MTILGLKLQAVAYFGCKCHFRQTIKSLKISLTSPFYTANSSFCIPFFPWFSASPRQTNPHQAMQHNEYKTNKFCDSSYPYCSCNCCWWGFLMIRVELTKYVHNNKYSLTHSHIKNSHNDMIIFSGCS